MYIFLSLKLRFLKTITFRNVKHAESKDQSAQTTHHPVSPKLSVGIQTTAPFAAPALRDLRGTAGFARGTHAQKNPVLEESQLWYRFTPIFQVKERISQDFAGFRGISWDFTGLWDSRGSPFRLYLTFRNIYKHCTMDQSTNKMREQKLKNLFSSNFLRDWRIL